MRTYEKIETVFQRDTFGTKRLIPNSWRNSTVEFLKDNEWEWTEKIDGTNIRVYWDGHSVTFGGRTERASIPAPLVNRLNQLFGGEENAQLFEHAFSWSFVMSLPLLIPAIIFNKTTALWFILAFYVINTCIHAAADHQKANAKKISLVDDQRIHMYQILITWVCVVANM